MNVERGDIEHGIFEDYDAAAEAVSIARARADGAAGRVVSNEVVMQWLKTWGTPDAGPCPREWLK